MNHNMNVFPFDLSNVKNSNYQYNNLQLPIFIGNTATQFTSFHFQRKSEIEYIMAAAEIAINGK